MRPVKIRMLAAIMFTDMVGYTAMMQKNEEEAKSKRDRQKKVLDNCITEHQGRILQYYGDGTLSIFGSAIEAIKCAVNIQIELNKQPVVPLRIGIHMGDVVYDDDGVYGDGVNVASRIETMATPGGVFISDKLYDEISNHPDLKAVPLGNYNLKNVKRPIGIYAISNEGLVVPSQKEVSVNEKVDKKKSIAVLPFVNMSGEPENEYFSDGMTEEILNALTKVDGLKVTSRTSSFMFKGRSEDIRQIGNQLNVSTVLEGSVRKAGNRVRITAQLINTNDGYHLWSESYDRNLEDIFEVQDEISRTIAYRLREKLSDTKADEPLVTSSTRNIDAYNFYLKGRYWWGKWTPGSIEKAMYYFKEAISIDPDFAKAYAGISNCYVYLGAIGYRKPEVAYPSAKEYALKALELERNDYESLISLAVVKLFFDWDWEGSEKLFKEALEKYPGTAQVHHTYTLFLTALGRIEEYLKEAEIAHQLDPLNLQINASLGMAYFYAGRYNDAIAQLEKTLELDPNFRVALSDLGWVYYASGDIDKSIETFEKFNKLTKSDWGGLTQLGYVYAKAGRIDDAKWCLEQLKERQKVEKEMALYMDLSVVYSGLNDFDKVFEYLNKAYEEKLGGLIFIKNNKFWSEIKTDPRFNALMEKMNFP